MCSCVRSFRTPTGGIPLVPEIHNQFTEDVKEAFIVFHKWIIEQNQPKRSEMPEEVSAAFEKIKKTEIPGYKGVTCESSCYVMSVEKNLID